MRLIQVLDGLVELDQLPAQFELRHHLARQAPQGFGLLEVELPRLEIDDAQGPQRIAFDGDERHAAVELEIGLAGDEGDSAEAGILPQVRRHDHLGAADRRRAKGDFPRTLVQVRRQAVLGLEPQAIVVHEADVGDWALADLRRELADLVIGDVGGCIEDIEGANSGEPLRLVGGYRERHRHTFLRPSCEGLSTRPRRRVAIVPEALRRFQPALRGSAGCAFWGNIG